MMLIATRNKGDAKDFRDRALDEPKFEEPNQQKTIDPAPNQVQFCNLQVDRKQSLANSPSLPPGSKVKELPLVPRKTISRRTANRPSPVTIPAKPANAMF